METDLVILENFIGRHPLSAARLLEGFSDEEAFAFIDETAIELVVPLLSVMNVYKAVRCLVFLEPRRAAELLEKVDIGTAVSLIGQLDEHFRRECLDRVSPDLSAAIRQKLEYPALSVGALMLPLAFSLRKDMKVREAIQTVKNNQDKLSSIVFVVDQENKLAGGVPLHKLFFAEENDPITIMMQTEIPGFYAGTLVESVRNHQIWYEYRSIPVVDSSQKLIGILSYEATRKDETKSDGELRRHVLETGVALGELYRIGLTGFLQSIVEVK